ncbi:MAG: hypothetical protein K8U03_24695 [Planctomycetia bacterium]|nr:hypothetical protein [Planctomycetia bacterium]
MPASRLAPKVWPAATILFAGPLGSGVGIAADILADVARLSHRTVARRRNFTHLAHSSTAIASSTPAKVGVLQLVSYGDATHAADAGVIDLAIAWDHASAAALRAAGVEAGEWIVVDSTSPRDSEVPTWRRDLLTDSALPNSTTSTAEPIHPSASSTGLQRTARALKLLSRRTPFTRELWQRVLKLHAPARRRRAATA